jgi:hypothetical protein
MASGGRVGTSGGQRLSNGITTSRQLREYQQPKNSCSSHTADASETTCQPPSRQHASRRASVLLCLCNELLNRLTRRLSKF